MSKHNKDIKFPNPNDKNKDEARKKMQDEMKNRMVHVERLKNMHKAMMKQISLIKPTMGRRMAEIRLEECVLYAINTVHEFGFATEQDIAELNKAIKEEDVN